MISVRIASDSGRMELYMKLLLHICCGPCAVYPLDELRKENIEISGYFFNPNIHPFDEFLKRMQGALLFADIRNLKLEIDMTFLQKVWEIFETGDNRRCTMCYEKRLEKTAEYAAKKKYDAFSTTLLVSPYQNHELIKEKGERAAKKYKIAFHYRDFRKGFREGQKIVKEMELYRQKYCGCIKSIL